MLGTLPGERSLACGEYYAHPQNRFSAAERPGSLDASIRTATVVPNDFSAFFARHPGMVRVCFNGQQAAKLFLRVVRA